MDDPFAMAAEDLAQSELAVDVTYRFVGGGPPLPDPVRVIFTEEEVETDGAMANGAGIMAIRTEVIVTAAALAPGRPQIGDTFGIGSASGWRVGNVSQDARGRRYRLTVGRQN